MADFFQYGSITTLHDLGTVQRDQLEQVLEESTDKSKIGLVLPVTAADMRAEPFARIIAELKEVRYIETICVVLGVAPDIQDYLEARKIVDTLGDRAEVLWTDGDRVQALYSELTASGLHLSVPGKGRSAWTAFGYLLADPRLTAFALHDCDIVNYDRVMLARLCLPMAHRSFDLSSARRTTRDVPTGCTGGWCGCW